jgi:hypothetical protein
VPEALLRVVSRYRDEHRPNEPFYLWARRTAAEELRSTLFGVGQAVTS